MPFNPRQWSGFDAMSSGFETGQRMRDSARERRSRNLDDELKRWRLKQAMREATMTLPDVGPSAGIRAAAMGGPAEPAPNLALEAFRDSLLAQMNIDKMAQSPWSKAASTLSPEQAATVKSLAAGPTPMPGVERFPSMPGPEPWKPEPRIYMGEKSYRPEMVEPTLGMAERIAALQQPERSRRAAMDLARETTGRELGVQKEKTRGEIEAARAKPGKGTKSVEERIREATERAEKEDNEKRKLWMEMYKVSQQGYRKQPVPPQPRMTATGAFGEALERLFRGAATPQEFEALIQNPSTPPELVEDMRNALTRFRLSGGI